MKILPFVKIAILLILAAPFEGFTLVETSFCSNDSIKTDSTGFIISIDKGLYKTTLDISKHHLSGFIFLKRTSDSSYRIIFSNQLGIKFFDFEFSGKEFIVHYCFPSLERKALLKLFETDFRTFLFPFEGIKKIQPMNSTQKDGNVFKVKIRSGKWFYTISGESKRIIQMNSRGKFFAKTRIGIQYTESSPSTIDISNPTIKLSLTMILLSP